MVIMICMKLYNLCTDREVTLPYRRLREDHMAGDQYLVWGNNDAYDDNLHRNRATGGHRLSMTTNLEDQGSPSACNVQRS
jgi:hypothetical protein